MMDEKKPAAMLAFTKTGYETMQRLASSIRTVHPDTEMIAQVRSKTMPDLSISETAEEWAGHWFDKAGVLIFFGATGIAVRSIAAYVKDKFADPAVLVIDEAGTYVISLLSGHVGGGNALAEECAALLGALPVITTATDGRGQFAVDVFAVKHGLTIENRVHAKEVSARLLAGETLRIYGPANTISELTERYPQLVETECRQDADIMLTCCREGSDKADALYLIPKDLVLGIGCRRDTPKATIEKVVLEKLVEAGVFLQSVSGIGSIDLKANEAGLIGFSEQLGVRFVTYSAEELMGVPGAFDRSEFVLKTTGCDNVCERSAMKLAGEQAILRMKKTAADGVTVAAAERYRRGELK